MKAFRTVVVAVILGAMFSPAISLAKTEPATAPVPARQIVQTGVTLAGAVASTANALNTRRRTRRAANRRSTLSVSSSRRMCRTSRVGRSTSTVAATLVLVFILIILLL